MRETRVLGIKWPQWHILIFEGQEKVDMRKCPHLLSHEMTGQVDSGTLDQFLSSPHVVLYPAVVSSCSAELCFVLGKDGLRYRLRTPCNFENSVFLGQYSNKREDVKKMGSQARDLNENLGSQARV